MAKNKRLMALAEAIKGYDTAIDIGTDHGYVLKYALDHHYIKKGIAADIAEQPLALARKNLEGYPVTFHLSDGFLNVQDSFDVAIIAGMGAYTISHIIKGAPKGDFDMILMAHDHLDDLRTFLSGNGYNIIYEKIIEVKRFYHLMKVERRIMNLTEKQRITGYHVVMDNVAAKYMLESHKKRALYATRATGDQAIQLKKESEYFLDMYESYQKGVSHQ
ncbi:MAG: class I SAM-dependent methyltransferase [Acholeplasmataceae bacterium]